MAIKKREKDNTKSEKQFLISLINDYSLFGAKQDDVLRNHKIMRNRIIRILFAIALLNQNDLKLKITLQKILDHDNNY